MNRIDMKDKFFHAIMFDSNEDELRLERFRRILQCGYLLSLREQTRRGNRIYTQQDYSLNGIESDDIFLSVYPSSKPPKISNTHYNVDGFYFTLESFFFILNSSLKYDCEVREGKYPGEFIVSREINLFKHLDGIGNTGYNIDYRLIIGYYFTKYLNGEIDLKSLVSAIDRFSIYYDARKEIREIVSAGYEDFYERYIRFSIDSSMEELLPDSDYSKVKKVLSEEHLNIPLYDIYGEEINPEERIREVKGMQQYIKRHSDKKTDVMWEIEQ